MLNFSLNPWGIYSTQLREFLKLGVSQSSSMAHLAKGEM